jgi:predicted DNA-binding transcriptional regulator YafY
MPKNKSASIRFRIIDQCINNKRHRFPSLELMADRCSELLQTDVSTSSIEKDIAVMKKPEPVGFSAPIAYSKTEKGYYYTEAGFSISELSLAEEEWNALRFSAQLLFQYREVPIFSDFRNVNGVKGSKV